MSQRSQSHHHHPHDHYGHHGHHHHGGQHRAYEHGEEPRREQPRSRFSRRVAAADYTLGHAGRQVRIGPVAFWTCVGTLVIMGGWTIITATYFAFQDDVLTRLLARQAEMQFAYEDRIAEMRAQVDRVASRQLLDQDQFERRLSQILQRQATLESRAAALGSLADPVVTGAIKPRADLKPAPIGDTAMSAAPAVPASAGRPRAAAKPAAGVEATLARIQDSLDRVEARQTASLNAIEGSYDAQVKRMRAVLSELGVDPGKAPSTTATGGPFVPYKLASVPTAFERQIHRISLVRAHADKLNKTMIAVPVRSPLAGDLDQSSGFGVRLDPFLGRPAMHTGLDFRGSSGEPVRATATGTVTTAGWSGGYGKMVEIDHGNGLSTRYGHMSDIAVHSGQHVRIGQIVGKVGSTGRSTGPHLHYETRVDGDAVDPHKFLRAGAKLGLN